MREYTEGGIGGRIDMRIMKEILRKYSVFFQGHFYYDIRVANSVSPETVTLFRGGSV